jgi:hypothetical protein
MNRRGLLAGVGISLSTAVAGCLGDGAFDGGDRENGDEEGDEQREVEPIEEDPRVDEPPHEITPQDDEDPDSWNDEYLGEEMATEPSLSFEVLPVTRRMLSDHGQRLTEYDTRIGEYWVEIVDTEDARDELLDIEEIHDEQLRERLEAVDFEDFLLIILETGYGSSSVGHRWARVEEGEKGVHLHGYYMDPLGRDGDISTTVSVLEVERPSKELIARVSLTVSQDLRVHFNSTEGVVTVDVHKDDCSPYR